MRHIIRLAIFFYVLVILAVGFTALLVLAHGVDYGRYSAFLKFVYTDEKASTIVGMVIAATMLISLVFARIIYGRQKDARQIHFENPLGRVTISMSALEDLIRRLTVHVPQVKEIKPEIFSSKKGLFVDLRLVLRSEVNIPEMTAELQDIIKRKIQGVIGSEERVHVRVHVMKIATEAAGKNYPDDTVVSPVPFQGYRA